MYTTALISIQLQDNCVAKIQVIGDQLGGEYQPYAPIGSPSPLSLYLTLPPFLYLVLFLSLFLPPLFIYLSLSPLSHSLSLSPSPLSLYISLSPLYLILFLSLPPPSLYHFLSLSLPSLSISFSLQPCFIIIGGCHHQGLGL